MANDLSAPRVIDLSESRRALYAVERNDGRGFVTWDEHTQKRDFGTPGTPMLLLWTTADLAERYNLLELRNTGRPYRIRRPYVLPFLRKMLAEARVEWVWLNRMPLETAERESGASGIAKTRDLIAYLSGGGRIAGQRRA